MASPSPIQVCCPARLCALAWSFGVLFSVARNFEVVPIFSEVSDHSVKVCAFWECAKQNRRGGAIAHTVIVWAQVNVTRVYACSTCVYMRAYASSICVSIQVLAWASGCGMRSDLQHSGRLQADAQQSFDECGKL